MKVTLPMGFGAFIHPSQPTNNQRTVNMFVTEPGPQGWGASQDNPQGTLLPTMGCMALIDLSTVVGDTFRGIAYVRGSFYCVVGKAAYKIEIDQLNLGLTVAQIGTFTHNTDKPVIITSNPDQVIFVDKSQEGYVYNTDTGVFTQIDADDDFLGGSHIVYIDGYGIYNETATNKFWVSELDDFTAWDALQVASAQGRPGDILALGVAKSELWIFKENSIEIWADEGLQPPGVPFAKRVGTDINIGIGAQYSVQSVNDRLIWLDSRGFIVQSDVSNLFRDQSTGYQLTKISTQALDDEIANYQIIGDAIGSTYTYRGHPMYEISFPFMNKTHVFDTITQQWHSREFFNYPTNQSLCSMGQFYAQNGSFIVGGNVRSGRLYIYGKDYLTDDASVIRRLRTTPYIHENFKEIEITELELKCKTGATNTNSLNITTNILSTTISSFTSNTILDTTIQHFTDFSGEHEYTTVGAPRNVTTLSGVTWIDFFVPGDISALDISGLSIAVKKNDGTFIFGYVGGNPIYNPTYFGGDKSLVRIVIAPGFTTSADPASPDFVGGGNKVVIECTSMTFTVDVDMSNVELSNPVLIALQDSTTLSVIPTSIDVDNFKITVPIDVNYAWHPAQYPNPPGPTSHYAIMGNAVTLDSSVFYTGNITLATTNGARVGDIIRITLNDGSNFTTIITSIIGNTITIQNSIATDSITIGNAITITREGIINPDPYIQMRYSHDGGYTWSAPMLRPFGKLGELNKRIMWNSLGSSTEWTFEFLITDILDFSIVDATINLTVEIA